jgi:ribosomal protein L19
MPFYSSYLISQNLTKLSNAPRVGDTVHVKYFAYERKYFRKKIRIRSIRKAFSGVCIALTRGAHRSTVLLRRALQNNVVEAAFNLSSPAILSLRWNLSRRATFSTRKLFWLRSKPNRYSRVKLNKKRNKNDRF